MIKDSIRHRCLALQTWISLLIAALLLSVPAAFAEKAGEVVSILGRAEILREGRWQPLQVGEAIAVGEMIKTAEGSRMAVQLSNGSQLKLNANSQLELKPPTDKKIPTSTEHFLQKIFRLLGGEIWVRGTQSLEIETISATATIRGTEFNLAVEPSGASRLAVLEGAVEFHNPYGRVLVVAHEQATAKKGEAPRKMMLVEPLDAVQWSLYYPTLPLDRTSQEKHRTPSGASGRWLAAAHNHLLRGEVPQAQQALDRTLALDPHDARAYSLRAIIDLVQNRKAGARINAERAVAADPASPVAYLTLSSTQQAEFDLDGALASARQAVALDPNSSHALIQESRLLFGMGEIKPALQTAERARQRAPDDALVNSTWGFLQLAKGRIDAAQQAFQTAIQQDSTLGEPHLGLGLALFRQNHTEDAVTEIEKATLLEPKVSLYNSYLGKAYYEIKDNSRAEKALAHAKQLDPRDPTPHFYDAVRLQSTNQPIQAVESLQASITLNDHRAVYRSKLLLDEDLAARTATLGRIYSRLGFGQLSVNESTHSLATDPANHSAHRLLADGYATQSRYEIARASEILQAQLLQPTNIIPIQPQLAETNLSLLGSGPTSISTHEFNPLFISGHPRLSIASLLGTQKTFSSEAIVSGATNSLSYSLGYFYYETDGFRENSDIRHDIYNIFTQFAISSDLNFQLELRQRNTEQGDLSRYFFKSFNVRERQEIDQRILRLGGHYKLALGSDILLSYIQSNRKESFEFEQIFNQATANQVEIQHLLKDSSYSLVSGLGANMTEKTSYLDQPIRQHHNAYLYANFKVLDNLHWTLGASYEWLDDEINRIKTDKFSPKLGLILDINSTLKLRAAYFETLKRALIGEQTIEPTQIGGFNQLYDDVNRTEAKVHALGLDYRFSENLQGGLQGVRRNLNTPSTLSPEDFTAEDEAALTAYLYWTPHPYWAIKSEYQLEYFRTEEKSPYLVRTLNMPLSIRYFDPSGFFGEVGFTYLKQKVTDFDLTSQYFSKITNVDDTVLINTGFGFRLPKRQGFVSLEVWNLLDQDFRFQDMSFRTSHQEQSISSYLIPERTIFSRLVLNF